MKNVVVLGKGDLCIKICEWFKKHEKLSYVVPVIPEPHWTESLVDWCELNQIDYVKSGNYRELPNSNKIDLAFSCFYDKIVKNDFIEKCTRILNLHNSPLPLYRGMRPINWALKDNRQKHGVTIHEITPGIDDGPIVSQVIFSIYPDFEEVEDVYLKALNYGYTLFRETMPILDNIEAKKQTGEIIYHSSLDNNLLGDREGHRRDVKTK